MADKSTKLIFIIWRTIISSKVLIKLLKSTSNQIKPNQIQSKLNLTLGTIKKKYKMNNKK